MKKCFKMKGFYNSWVKKLWLMTRLCVFMVLFSLGVASANVYSQNAKLTLKMDNSKLVDVFNSIEEQTNFYFFYNRDLLDDQQIVTVDMENKNVDEVLKELFRDTNISYRIENRNILIEVQHINGIQTNKQQPVTGKVTDTTGAPLPGVTVVVKGTTNGTITNFDGVYSLSNVPSDGIIQFSFVGMKMQEISVAGKSSINIVLEEESIGLEEVVAIGYGTMKKSDLTGSLSSVKTEELVSYPSINPVQALSGKASGVRVVQNSGQPGGTISIQIRGGNSINGDNDPLYVIDGFPIAGNPTMLNTSDIESIDILKDASATAIYGSRGANGVVLITTKSGKKGTSKITLDSYYGIQQVINKIDMLDAKQFAEIANLRAANDGNNPFFTSSEIQSFGKGTDWQDEIFSIAPIQNHTIAFSGGNEKTKYSLSGSVFDQEGIIKPTDYQRLSIRSNFEQKFGEKLTLTFSSIISKIKQNSAPVDNGSRGSSILSAALLAPPTLSPYDEDDNYTDIREYSFSPGVAQNPIALMNERLDEKNANTALTNAALTFEIIKNLKLKTSIGIESIDSKRDDYRSSKLFTSPTGSASTTFFKRTNILNENILTYDLDIDDNNALNLTGGFTYQTNEESSNTMSASGFTTDALLNNSLQSGDTPGIPTSSVHEWTLLSWLGRVNYTIKDKYLLTASFRADGSSRFGSENKWGYFPSAAFAWRMTEEEFIKNLNLFSNLKLRASWGRTGSTAISPYQTLNTLGASSIIFDKDLYVDFAPGTQLPNSALKWETTASYNLGFDFGFAKDRIRFTADYYSKKTTDLLAVTNLPPSLGYSSILQNIGAVQNRGIELSMNAGILTRDLKWNATLNVSSNKNKVLELVEGDDIYGANLPNPINTSVNITREGESVGIFYGYLEDGLDDSGKIVYKDISGPDGTPDGAITADDKTIIGNPYPDLIFGLNNDFSYKNFSLNVFIQGVYGNDMWNNNLADYANSFNIGINQIASLAGNYWTSENPDPNALYPEISTTSLYRESDRFIEDGSYIRLKNVRLNYNIPLDNIKVNWLKAVQVYVSAQNLLTLTNYSWYDPDVSTKGGGTSISPGIDQTAYPSAKTYTFGVHVEF